MVRTKRTSLIVDPANGRLPPLTPEGQRRVDAERGFRRVYGRVSEIGPGGLSDNPEDRPQDRCRGMTVPCIGALCAFSRIILQDNRGNQIFEAACHEGNYAMTNVLAGARVAERAQRGRRMRVDVPVALGSESAFRFRLVPRRLPSYGACIFSRIEVPGGNDRVRVPGTFALFVLRIGNRIRNGSTLQEAAEHQAPGSASPPSSLGCVLPHGRRGRALLRRQRPPFARRDFRDPGVGCNGS